MISNGIRNLKAISRILLSRLDLYSKLVAIEVKIETTLFVRRLVWVGVGVVFGFFALAMLHVVILGHFWETEYRLISLIFVFFVDGFIAGISLYIASRPARLEPFAVTKHQLSEDIKFVKESI